MLPRLSWSGAPTHVFDVAFKRSVSAAFWEMGVYAVGNPWNLAAGWLELREYQKGEESSVISKWGFNVSRQEAYRTWSRFWNGVGKVKMSSVCLSVED